MTLFGLCACLLAGAGVFGVTARGVTRRIREVGIRRALEARDNQLRHGRRRTRTPSRQDAIPAGTVNQRRWKAE